MRFWLYLLVIAAFGLCIQSAKSRDMDGLSETLTPYQKEWVRGLRNKNGMNCCNDGDSYKIQAEELRETGYWIKWEGLWLEVPASALLITPNLIGVARVWIWHENGVPKVRCFIPGPLG